MFRKLSLTAASFALITMLLVYAQPNAQTQSKPAPTPAPAPTQQKDPTTLQLAISKDGLSIVDQNGNVVARFVEGMQVKMTTEGVKADIQAAGQKKEEGTVGSLTIKGCLKCVDECLIYDSNGNCVKWYRSCTWHFDC
jgi:hypothetical protein